MESLRERMEILASPFHSHTIAGSDFLSNPPWRSEFTESEAIWLIGTTHISKQSPSDVLRVIRALRPDNVVVELCRSRAGIMYTSNNGELNQQLSFLKKILVIFSHITGGLTALALHLLFAAFSSKMSSDIDRPFGDEFRAARKASEEIGAQLMLGDRPIEITVCRPRDYETMSSFVFFTSISLKLDDFVPPHLKESSTGDDNFQLYKQLSSSHPSLLPPLVYELIHKYLAWYLKRSKAVNNSKKVVGVIGKGHMNGVIHSLVSDQGNLRFRDLQGTTAAGLVPMSKTWYEMV